MPVDSSLSVQTSRGLLSVTAQTQSMRVLKIGKNLWSFELAPRPERWYGSLGLYLPAAGHAQNINLPLEEYQAHHASFRALDQDIDGLSNDASNHRIKNSLSARGTHWNASGLEVLAEVRQATPSGKVLDLDLVVIQHCVNGEKPTHLRGAQGDIYLKDRRGRHIDSLPCRRVGPNADIDAWTQNYPESK